MYYERIWESGGGGGRTYRAILGGETYCRAPSKPGLEASESGIRLVCPRFL